MTKKYARGQETEIKILRHLALHHEVYQANIPKHINRSNRTVRRTLRSFEKSNLTKFRTEPRSRGGKDNHIWSITFNGLHRVILTDPEADGIVAKVIKEVDDAVDFARRSPLPEPETALTGLWA